MGLVRIFFNQHVGLCLKILGCVRSRYQKLSTPHRGISIFFSQRGFCITGIGQLSPSLHGAKRDEVIDSTCSFDALSRFLDEVERSEPLPDLRIGTIERIDDDTVKVSFVLEKRQGRI
jgi:hypothetical protein